MLSHVLERVELRWALLGSALTPALVAGLALRWRIFVGQQRLVVPFTTMFSLTWAGQFFNSVLPGSTGGDVVKIYELCRLAPQRKAAAAATVFADRLSALIALLVMAGVAFLVDPVPLRVVAPQRFGLGGMLLAAAILALAAFAAGWLVLRATRSTQLSGRVLRTFTAARENFRLNAGTVTAIAMAFALHCLNFLIFYCFCRALHVSISYTQVLLMMPVLLFIVMLPVTINGHGLRELLLIAYFAHLGINIAGRSEVAVQEVAVAVSLLGVANDLLWSIPGGIWYFARGPAVPPNAEVQPQ